MTIERVDPHSEGDPGHDAHLRAALRHAPDAALSAPDTLRRQILQAAHAQAHARPTAARRTLASVVGGWFVALTRPPLAGGLASLMVAVLGGWIWWGQSVDLTAPPLQDLPAAREEQVAAAPVPTTPAPVASPSAPPRATAEAPRPAARRALPPPPVAADAAPPAPAPAAAPAPPMAARPPPAESFADQRRAEEVADRSRRAKAREVAPMAAASALAAAPPASEPEDLNGLRQQVQTAAGAWQARVTTDAAPDAVHNLGSEPRLLALLDRLHALVGDRWQPSPAEPGSTPPVKAELLLQLTGQSPQTLRLQGGALVWQRVVDGRPEHWHAPLSSEQAAAVQQAFAAAMH